MINRSSIFLNRFVILALVTLSIFLFVSFFTHDPHWLNRGGALISAFSAGAIFFQIKFEIGLENERQQLQEPLHKRDKSVSLSPVERVENLLKTKKIDHQDGKLITERLQVVAIIAVCAFVGEFLHGFGDLVLLLLFDGLFAH